ncbi:acetyl/propionyl/methylcrotonyl-CoA carboxylase subunit alpha [Hyphococcus luteus]|uniref:3-methylcrotonyl-CoA carboxylase n=1 Tax=Hyphococcus luteus TaxID=2058213 RepID=A0A2S7K9M8_9PROT|nr:acetyl/propionyl/methylcrotonyl-CoA carboxylase subunit alpha [Marinicaulis flavus]PQA89181.1 3-methylcrotonyl-CoA carboxylase [Marinicaulis flavus]
MFKKILIANRGEIAVRVAKTARKMGVATVAVYSDADKNAPHVRACDEAVHIGPSAAAESYLVADKIIDACKMTGAEAVHPGYGFLSENSGFADALDEARIVFIAPTAETIRAMGSKSAAKDLMEAANVPTTPGYQGEDQSVETFKREAERIGYPVLLKATAGGGGKGMRMVEKESALEDALVSAQREAKSAFGDDRFLIEKYVTRARHVEVQIFGDGKGDVVHMFERDCSVQRRHQKVIEEAPAPDLPADTRAALLKAGVDAGKAVNYRGAGTVEFLYDADNDAVYFMEMNTRLQVEHPVSEMITGQDFVEWQLRIAAGEGLPLAQDDITEKGHAFEARLYAENPNQNFAPSIGTLTTLRLPEDTARIDSGVEEGQEIAPFYDPMIAKIVTYGQSREEALGAMRSALAETRVAGLETNAAFLHALAAEPDFIAGDVSTKFIEEHEEALFAEHPAGPKQWAAAALWKRGTYASNDNDPWGALTGFRLNRPRHEVMWIEHEGAAALLRLSKTGDEFNATLEPEASAAARREGREPKAPVTFSFFGTAEDGAMRLAVEGDNVTAFAAPHGDHLRVWIGADHWDIAFPDPLAGISAHHSSEGSLTAPMPGVVTLLSAEVGDAVEAGKPLLVMEAMKMEHAIKAPFDGIVKAYKFQPGDQVKDGELLVEFEESA